MAAGSSSRIMAPARSPDTHGMSRRQLEHLVDEHNDNMPLAEFVAEERFFEQLLNPAAVSHRDANMFGSPSRSPSPQPKAKAKVKAKAKAKGKGDKGKGKGDMTITIRTKDGKRYRLNVKASDTIHSVKVRIRPFTWNDNLNSGIPPEVQRLTFKYKLLEDDRTLSYYNIVAGSVVGLGWREESIEDYMGLVDQEDVDL